MGEADSLRLLSAATIIPIATRRLAARDPRTFLRELATRAVSSL